jgi:putative PIN family toxin of toxin-antitoxin system
MIRVVLDTNIVVSATLRAGGSPEVVFNLAIDGVILLCVSEPVLAEYEEVWRARGWRYHLPRWQTRSPESGRKASR